MAERRPTLKELAARISAHLTRFEWDPTINRRVQGLQPYYRAGAWYTGGAKILVKYIAYQHGTYLTRTEAEAYLTWLDAGNVGTHYSVLRKHGQTKT